MSDVKVGMGQNWSILADDRADDSDNGFTGRQFPVTWTSFPMPTAHTTLDRLDFALVNAKTNIQTGSLSSVALAQ